MVKVAKIESDKSPIACKDNQLIQLRGQIIRRDTITAIQQKIVAYSASLVRPEDEANKRYEMTIKEFAELCDITTGGEIYKSVYRQASNLQRKGVDLITEDGEISIANFLVDTKVSRKKGTISFKLSEHLVPYYKQYSGQFSRINLMDYMPMKGRYALLLYELLLSWMAKGSVIYTIDDLRKLLDVPDSKYKLFGHLRDRVIDPAVKEINEKSTIFTVQMNEKKGKRNKVEAITFTIKKITSETSREDLTRLLISEGLNPPVAQSLIESYSSERITGNVQLAKNRAKAGQVENLAAYISRAITEDYAEIEIEQPRLFNQEKAEEKEKVIALAAAQLAALEKETAAATVSPDSPFAHIAKKVGIL